MNFFPGGPELAREVRFQDIVFQNGAACVAPWHGLALINFEVMACVFLAMIRMCGEKVAPILLGKTRVVSNCAWSEMVFKILHKAS